MDANFIKFVVVAKILLKIFLQKTNTSQKPLKSPQLFLASCYCKVFYKTNLSSSSAVMMFIVKLATGNATAVLKRFKTPAPATSC